MTTSLLESTHDLLQQSQAAAASAKAQAELTYRELLARSSAPRKGDAAKLLEVAAVLGITMADVQADVAAAIEGREVAGDARPRDAAFAAKHFQKPCREVARCDRRGRPSGRPRGPN